MTKPFLLALALFLGSNLSKAQYIKIDYGLLSSSFNNSKKLPILYDKIDAHALTIGVEFLERKWFYLSSQAGFMKIGGKETNSNFGGDSTYIKDSRAYAHFNTTIRGYKTFDLLTAFIGVGPFLNVLAGSRPFEHPIYTDFYRFKTYAGGKGEIGISYNAKAIKISIIGSYLMDLSGAAGSEAFKLTNDNLGAFVSVGYKLKRNKRE